MSDRRPAFTDCDGSSGSSIDDETGNDGVDTLTAIQPDTRLTNGNVVITNDYDNYDYDYDYYYNYTYNYYNIVLDSGRGRLPQARIHGGRPGAATRLQTCSLPPPP